VPTDFETEDVAEKLAHHGFRLDKLALFVWEAVTQYLTKDGVRRTLTFLSKATVGSQLIFTYVRADFLNGANMYGARQLYQQFVSSGIWRFGIEPNNVAGLLHEYGWAEREQIGRSEYLARYIAPSGRSLTVSEIERFVYAEKL
jgi:methyltransferase (TIGR00027 family)